MVGICFWKISAEGYAKSREESRFVELSGLMVTNRPSVQSSSGTNPHVWGHLCSHNLLCCTYCLIHLNGSPNDFSRPCHREPLLRTIFSDTRTAHPRNVIMITLYFGKFQRGIDWCQPRFVRYTVSDIWRKATWLKIHSCNLNFLSFCELFWYWGPFSFSWLWNGPCRDIRGRTALLI